uniref:Uncharacterized protein n=1 Tax=Arundo donax TaxID=35708 RepID=A0A0A8YLL4_ARUDO
MSLTVMSTNQDDTKKKLMSNYHVWLHLKCIMSG